MITDVSHPGRAARREPPSLSSFTLTDDAEDGLRQEKSLLGRVGRCSQPGGGGGVGGGVAGCCSFERTKETAAEARRGARWPGPNPASAVTSREAVNLPPAAPGPSSLTL